MTIKNGFLRAIPFARRARKFLRSRRGTIAPMMALLLVPIVSIMGVATQAGSWFLIQRAMQNAADSAVIAAATNDGNGGTDYVAEARSVTADYGFTHGSNNVTVTVPLPTTYAGVTSCAGAKCYDVKITMVAPLYLLQLLGYNGNAASSGGRGQTLRAGALATLKTINSVFCLTALGGGGGKKGDGILANGVPKSTIGCNIQSAGNSTCHGHSLTSGYSDAVGSNDCGTHQHTVASVTDPYASLASNIPSSAASGCSNYYPDNDPKWTGSGGNGLLLSTTTTLPAVSYACGDVMVTGSPTINTAAGGSVLVIENGALDVQGTLLSNNLTIIFTSPGGDQYTECVGKKCSTQVTNGPTGGGTLDISSPTSGTWSGVAMYQDPTLPEQSISYTGNSPTWNMSGIIYLPKTDFSASGAVNKSTDGFSCFTLVVNTIQINGTGDLFYVNDQSQCALQGVTSPTNAAYVIGQLVY